MKRFERTPEKNARRIHPVRLIIACTLIAVLLVSTSVGLSYARYHSVSSASDDMYFMGNDFVHADNVVIAYINRTDAAAPTVLNYNNDVIVTVPRGLSAEDTSVAYALIVKGFSPAAYDVVSGAYKVSADLQLVGLSDVAKDDSGSFAVDYYDIADANSSIDAKIKIENSAFEMKYASIADSDLVDGEYGIASENSTYYADFNSVAGLGTKTSSTVLSAAYSKKNWDYDGYVDTDWYDDSVYVDQYDLSTAPELAGLAKLVNDGVDFEGVTINLTSNISLFGGAVSGDRREWTPIGTAEHPFKGNFNGNGKTIYGLTLSGATEAENVGLFGVVAGTPASFIKDFKLDSPVVYGLDGNNTGTVIGKATGYVVSDVVIDDLDIRKESDGTENVGMIAGLADSVFSYERCEIHLLTRAAYDYVGNTADVSDEAPEETPTEAPAQDSTDAPADDTDKSE